MSAIGFASRRVVACCVAYDLGGCGLGSLTRELFSEVVGCGEEDERGMEDVVVS